MQPSKASLGLAQLIVLPRSDVTPSCRTRPSCNPSTGSTFAVTQNEEVAQQIEGNEEI